MELNIKDLLSPNYSERPMQMPIDAVVLHYTGMKTAEEAIERLRDPEAKVSAHYLIKEDGEIVRLVPEEKQAWHAGISCWQGKAALNENSIGIEIVNPGHEWGYRPFPKVQMESVLKLSNNIVMRYHIEPKNIVGHSDIAPTRKEDPGELFDWRYLAENGVGVWVDVGKVKKPAALIASPGDESVTVASFQKMLSTYGYFIRVDGYYGPKTEAIIRAFKRHFIQDEVNAFWNNRAHAVLEALLLRSIVQSV